MTVSAVQSEAVAVKLRDAILDVRSQLASQVIGQEETIDSVLAAILAGGHVLLEGGPGLGKTLLIKLLGRMLGLSVKRIQFTPDLMPSDILGGHVLDSTPDGPVARFRPGPIFAQCVLADEINRANPRTQAAMLEAMAEGQVTIAGESQMLEKPFFVLATNNPIDMEGTYPLPEAQADRFMMKLVVNPPKKEDLVRILDVRPALALESIRETMTAGELNTYQAHVADLPVSNAIRSLIADIIITTQPSENDGKVQLGASPRAGQALLAVARARAAIGGRLHVTEADVTSMVPSVLRHRIVLSYAGRAQGLSADAFVEELAARFR